MRAEHFFGLLAKSKCRSLPGMSCEAIFPKNPRENKNLPSAEVEERSLAFAREDGVGNAGGWEKRAARREVSEEGLSTAWWVRSRSGRGGARELDQEAPCKRV